MERSGRLLWCASAAALGLLPLLPAALAQETVPEPVQRELLAATEQLERAVTEFEGPQQSRSIVLFDEIINRLENIGRQGALPPRGRDVLVQCYELRGRAYFGIGLREKASADFRSLVQIRPDHVLSKETVSPKIVEVFNNVKKGLVAYVAVSSKPAGRGWPWSEAVVRASSWGSPISSPSRSWPETTRSRS